MARAWSGMRNILILLLLVLLPAAPLHAAESALEACARLAAHPQEEIGVSAAFESLATSDALPVCQQAHAEAPDDAATTYRLGRVFAAKGSHLEAAQFFLEAALAGYPMAQAAYSAILREGRGVQWDPVASLTWLKRAADQGHAGSQLELGTLYLDGLGVAPDVDKAEQAYLAAASHGLAAGWWGLGNIYSREYAGRIDRPRAIRYYEQALAANVPEAGVDLGRLKLCDCPERDLDGAIALFEAASELDIAPGWYQLGMVYVDNQFGRRDPARAVAAFQRAADLGDVHAAFQLGLVFEREAERRPEVRADSEKWLRIAARAGLPEAQLALGKALLFAPEDRRNQEDGTRWLESAAAAGMLDDFILLYDYFIQPGVDDLDRVYEYGMIASQFADPQIANWGAYMMEQVMERKRLEGLEPPRPPLGSGRG
ncbi:MAG: sel1 repeat family protein [Hyphomicrobiales bacterium]|nr:MAG: sel1 repeat family protein [Hyphomicrobiales bacterium]